MEPAGRRGRNRRNAARGGGARSPRRNLPRRRRRTGRRGARQHPPRRRRPRRVPLHHRRLRLPPSRPGGDGCHLRIGCGRRGVGRRGGARRVSCPCDSDGGHPEGDCVMKIFAASLAVFVAFAVQRPAPPPPSGELVELDVVALDRQQQPVTDLRREDFQIKEDGRPVDLKTFDYVVTLGSLQPDDGRTVTLLMDDIGVSITGTAAMQGIAEAVLSPAGRGDDLSIVRLSKGNDEAFGDFRTARDRIDGYRGGMVPFSRRDTPETMLKAVARIAKQLEPVEHRRKTIICLGLTAVCDVEQPRLGSYNVLWQAWVAALSA